MGISLCFGPDAQLLGVSGAPPGAQPWIGGVGRANPLPDTSTEARALQKAGSVHSSVPQVCSRYQCEIVTFRIIKLISRLRLQGLGT